MSKIVTNTKDTLQKKASSLKLEAMVIEDYVNELESKGFDWNQVTSTQYEVILDIIQHRIKESQK